MSNERRNSLFGPVLLIGIGVLLLLSNFGIVDIDIWDLIFRFWPVLLIAAGLDILFGRRSGAGAIIALVVIVVLIAGALTWGATDLSAVANDPAAQSIFQGLNGDQRAEITLAAGVGQLHLAGAPAPDTLIEGTIIPHRNERIVSDFEQEGDTAIYTLKSEGGRFLFPSWGGRARGVWDLRITQSIPVELTVSTGVGESTIDLGLVQLSGLDIDTGVGETTITLPGRGAYSARVNGGVGEVTVLIPDTIAARIQADAGIGSVDVQGDYLHEGDEYLSPGYNTAEQKVELDIDGGVGSIAVRQIQQR
jgi:signal transduction histidine kinase